MNIPDFKITYEGADITSDIRSLVSAITFTDKMEGESDECQLTLDNSDLRWLGSWFPQPGDRVTLQLGYVDNLFPAVSLEVDEPEFSGVPDKVTIKGVATPISKSLRQKNTTAFEGQTLRQIAQAIADKHGLELVGEVPDIKLERVTQKEESDLSFLKDLAADYGLVFKVESTTKLVFYKESELEAAAVAIVLTRSQISPYQIKKGAANTYKSAKASYLDPKTGEYIEAEIDADGNEVATTVDGESDIKTKDTLNIRERSENKEQALTKAREQLRRANRGQIEGRLDVEGNPNLAAGTNLELQGFAGLSGKYQIKSVQHSITRAQGYRCSIEIKGLEITAEKAE